MATNTYVALDKVTTTGTVSSITFSSINSGYTDLVIVWNGKCTGGGTSIDMQFNSDTASNYSNTRIYGTGSAAGSDRTSSQTATRAGLISTADSMGIIQVQNYSNSTTYKTQLNRAGQSDGWTTAGVGLWRSTAAISSITLLPSGASFTSGATFSLYGIKAEGVSPAAKATGGAIYSDDLYYYHVFGSTGTFTPLQSLTADILCVAGGGGGGHAGGGAGGLLGFTSQSLTATGYTVTVGAGGAANTYSSSQAQVYASIGGNSQFGALTTAVGGGGGGNQNSTNGTGGTGGSGGGEGYGRGSNSVGSGTSNQGYAGGLGKSDLSTYTVGGGGGGAGAAGTAATGNNAAGNGGNGATYNTLVGGTAGPYSFIDAMGAATGTGQLVSGHYYYAGGGAGNWGGSPGYGGGGISPSTASGTGGAGTANTGGGGSGGDPSGGGNGGSGIVIVRYAKV